MKRSERHHLKDNPLATFVSELTETDWVNTRSVTGAALVVGALVIAGAVFGWQQYRSSQASALLATAMAIVDAPVISQDATGETAEGGLPATAEFPSVAAKLETAVPRLLEAADAYPSLSPGIAARYQAAAALGTLGRSDEADAQYQRVIELAGGGNVRPHGPSRPRRGAAGHGRPRRRHCPSGGGLGCLGDGRCRAGRVMRC